MGSKSHSLHVKTSNDPCSSKIWEFSTFMSDLLCNESLQYLPAAVHGPKTLSKVSFVTAFPLHILTADLQNWLIHKVHSQLLTGQVNLKTLLRGVNKEREIWCLSRSTKLSFEYITVLSAFSNFFLPCISEGTFVQPQIPLPPWSSAGPLGWHSPWGISSSLALLLHDGMATSPSAAVCHNMNATISNFFNWNGPVQPVPVIIPGGVSPGPQGYEWEDQPIASLPGPSLPWVLPCPLSSTGVADFPGSELMCAKTIWRPPLWRIPVDMEMILSVSVKVKPKPLLARKFNSCSHQEGMKMVSDGL